MSARPSKYALLAAMPTFKDGEIAITAPAHYVLEVDAGHRAARAPGKARPGNIQLQITYTCPCNDKEELYIVREFPAELPDRLLQREFEDMLELARHEIKEHSR